MRWTCALATRDRLVAAMKSFGLPKLPVIGDSSRGTWSGWARYQDEKWSSESQIRDAALSRGRIRRHRWN